MLQQRKILAAVRMRSLLPVRQKLTKPDPRIYHALRQIRSFQRESIFIDDNTPMRPPLTRISPGSIKNVRTLQRAC